jgi:hypothetical protein
VCEVRKGVHTKATNGYLSMRSRMFRISLSRLGAHTSRMGDIFFFLPALGAFPALLSERECLRRGESVKREETSRPLARKSA